MEAGEIKVIWRDTGHWVARCNHETGVIELNRREFPRLSPMMQDYVFCHEYVHLLCDETDENRCNLITDRVFIERGRTEADRRIRAEFVNRSNSDGPETSHSFLAVASIVSAVAGIVNSVISAFSAAKQKSGYYALSKTERRKLVEGFVAKAFEASRNTSDKSAQEIFWEYMSQCDTGDANYRAWLVKNSFISKYIRDNEQKYGFKFGGVYNIRYIDYPSVKVAVALAFALGVFIIYRTSKK